MKLSVLRKHLEELEKAALEKGNTDPDVTFYSSPHDTLHINEDCLNGINDYCDSVNDDGDIHIALDEL